MFYLLATLYCKILQYKVANRWNRYCVLLVIFLVSKNDNPCFAFFHGPHFTPLSLPGLVVSYPNQCSSAICGQNLENASFYASVMSILKYMFGNQSLLRCFSEADGAPSEADWLIFNNFPRMCRGWRGWWGSLLYFRGTVLVLPISL